ncbi:Cytochrome C [Gammaproteobacteria bacterium]
MKIRNSILPRFFDRMTAFFTFIGWVGMAIISTAIPWLMSSAHALPSYARQTGEDCGSCHVGSFGPQLTPHGIRFKLEGYTDSDSKSGKVPLSGMVVGTFTHTRKGQDPAPDHFSSNDNTVLQEASVFLAGGLTEHLGTFVQATYSDVDRHFVFDHMDVRYAHSLQLAGADTILGISVNNLPTVQDPFNTLPAWGFPFTSSALAPAPGSSSLLSGGFDHQALGMTVYGLWDNHFYAEVGGYRTLSNRIQSDLSVGGAGSDHIYGFAPYGRLAYFKDLRKEAYSFGLVGFSADVEPGGVGGVMDKYRDLGIDASYQFLGDRRHVMSFQGSLIHETQTLNATDAADPKGHLNQLDLAVSYYHNRTYGISLKEFDINSSRADSDSRGTVLQADWTPFGKEESWGAPWANLRLGLQYTLYNKFDGTSDNAGNNNTLMAFVWTAF